MIRRTIASALVVTAISMATAGSARAEGYDTNASVGYSPFAHSFGETSGVGLNFGVSTLLRKWVDYKMGAEGTVEFIKFLSGSLKEYEGHAVIQNTKNPARMPFAKVGVGLDKSFGDTATIVSFNGGMDFQLKPDQKFMVRAMFGVKKILYDGGSDTLSRLSVGVVFPIGQ